MDLVMKDGKYTGVTPSIPGKKIAVYGELQFQDDHFPYSLVTLVYCE
jgi:hypothetical protein